MSNGRRQLGLLAVCLALVGWVNAQFALHPQLGDWGGDNAYYLILAEHLSRPSDVTAHVLAQVPYPWGFPALIYALGGGMHNWMAGHQAVLLSFMVALVVAGWWWRQQIGVAAVLLVAVVGLLPGSLLINTEILSENSYLACAMLACAASDRARADPRWWLLALLATAAAISCRSVGIVLLPAVAWGMWPALRQKNQWALATLVGLGVTGAVLTLTSRGVSNYVSIHSKLEQADWGTFLAQQWQALSAGGVELLHPLGGSPYVALILLVLSLVGCSIRLWRWHADAAYVVAYAVVLVTWPYPAEAGRLLYAIAPLLLWLAWHGAVWISDKLPPVLSYRAAAPYLMTLLIVIDMAPASLQLIAHSQRQFPAALQPYRGMTAVVKAPELAQAMRVAEEKAFSIESLQRVGRLLPPDACVQAIKPSIVTLYTGRKSRVPLPPRASQADFATSLASCPYLLMMAFNSPTFPQMYPADRLDGISVALIEKFERLRPDGQVWYFGALGRRGQ